MSKAMFFRTNYSSRSKSGRLIADALNKIGHALNNISIDGNDAEVTASGIRLTSDAVFIDDSFRGIYRFKGKRYALSGPAKQNFYHDEDSEKGFWTDDPIPDEQPARQYWRKAASCRHDEPIMC